MTTFSLYILAFSFFQLVASNTNICIIGSGISAGSTAFFIRQYSRNTATIKVFEKQDNIGGRVASFNYKKNVSIEAGGSVIHSENRYMMKFAELLGLQVRHASEGDKIMGIYNGDQFVFKATGWSWVDNFQMLWRYHYHLLKMDTFVKKMISNFNRIYQLQDNEKCYSNPVDMLKDIGVYNLTQSTLHQVLTEQGISDQLINEVAAAINRVNYGQNTTLNGFSGAVGLAGSGPKLRAVVNGNKQIIEMLLKEAKAEIKTKHAVTSIAKSNNGYELEVNGDVEECNAVVIATPLEHTNIKLPEELTGKLYKGRKLQLTETTFVEGRLNSTYFLSMDAGSVPEIILTTENPALPFSSIGLAHRIDESSGLYKIFSRKPLSEENLYQLFSTFKVVRIYPWLAYPKFDPPEQFSDFVLDKRLIYVNAIETAASALEVMSLSGRNAALLLKKEFSWSGSSIKFASESWAEL